MSRKFLTALDLSKNELQNAAIQNLASAPASPVKGQLYFNTTAGDNTLYWFDGTVWVAAKSSGGGGFYQTVRQNGVAAAQRLATNFMNSGGMSWTISDDAANSESEVQVNPVYGSTTAETTFGLAKADGSSPQLARTDHVHGTPAHSAAEHATIPLSALAPATGPINMGGFVIGNVGTPVAPTDAANKSYVDNAAAGLSWKEAVRVASPPAFNMTIMSGLVTVDGVVTVAGDRVLLKDQATASSNGIWIASAGAWVRATDADASGEIDGMAVFVMEGTVNADTAWVCTTNAPIVVGTTNLAFSQFAGGGTITPGAGLYQTGNVFNIGQDGSASIVVGADTISRAALNGDVDAVVGSNTVTIRDGVVTNAKLANMPALTIKGNNTLGANSPADLTLSAMVAAFGFARKALGGTTAGTTTVFNHGLNTQWVTVSVIRSTAPFDEVECDIECTSASTVTVRFAAAVGASDYWILAVG